MACQSALNNSASPSTNQDPPPPARASIAAAIEKGRGKNRDFSGIQTRSGLLPTLTVTRCPVLSSGKEIRQVATKRKRSKNPSTVALRAICSTVLEKDRQRSRLSPRCKHPPELVCSDGKRKTCKRKFNRSLKFK